MKQIKFIIAICLLGLSFVSAASGDLAEYFSRSADLSEATVDHSAWNRLVGKYIQHSDGLNLFAYSAVSESDRTDLSEYIEALEEARVTALNSDEQFAYWINLYNAVTIRVILDHYPVESIREISFTFLTRGPWKEPLVTVEGMALSLDDIEHGILRPIFADSRIHYAVNCASIGCPNLQNKAFTSENLEELLEKAATQYINHPRAVAIQDDELIVSSIFDWYADDFGDDESEIIEHILEYATPDLFEKLSGRDEIDNYEYDWTLNEPGNA